MKRPIDDSSSSYEVNAGKKEDAEDPLSFSFSFGGERFTFDFDTVSKAEQFFNFMAAVYRKLGETKR